MTKNFNKLTNIEVQKAKVSPPARYTKLYDGNGLILLVRTRSKGWLFRYKHPVLRKDKEFIIGNYPQMSLSEARAVVNEYQDLLARGIDPKIHRDTFAFNKIKNTFGEVALAWFEWKKLSRDFSDYTAKKAWRLIEKHLFPIFEHMPITEMTPRAVLYSLEGLKREGKLETISRVNQKLNEIMIFALHREIISENKMANLSKEFDTPKTKHNPCISPSALPKFFTDLFYSSADRQTVNLILWQMLTLSRPSETAKARWEDIDEEAGIWSYYILKGNKENDLGRLHKVPLSRQALKLLEEIKGYRRKDNPFLFPHYTSRLEARSSQSANMAIKRMANGYYAGRQTSHGLRSIASTWLNESSCYPPDIIEVALSHVNNDPVRKAYNRAEYIEQRRAMLQDWADFLESCGAMF